MNDTTLKDQSDAVGAIPYVEAKWAGAGIVPFGDPVLHSATGELEAITEETKVLARYMVEVMHARNGIGLAANQVGLPYRMFVHNLPKVAPQVVINPTIVDLDGRWEYVEGCLSMTLDQTRAKTFRPKTIVVEALNIEGEQLRIAADELLARVFLHEIDHLDGFVYVQRLVGAERKRVYGTMQKNGVEVGQLRSQPYHFEIGECDKAR